MPANLTKTTVSQIAEDLNLSAEDIQTVTNEFHSLFDPCETR